MARARNIKPGFFLNDELAALPCEARLLFIGLWTIADRCGRLEDRPRRIAAELFPYDTVDVDALLQSLHDSSERFIVRYEVDGTRYIQVTNFEAHQNPHKTERDSTIPAPCKHGANTVQEPNEHTTNPADSLNHESLFSDSLIPDSPPNPLTGEAAAPQGESRKRFAPPTVEQVATYCRERNNGIDPNSFVDFYQSKGWVIGKSPMKDWKAAVRQWEQKRKEQGAPAPGGPKQEGRVLQRWD